jgi:hypothetical protein
MASCGGDDGGKTGDECWWLKAMTDIERRERSGCRKTEWGRLVFDQLCILFSPPLDPELHLHL